TYDAGTGQPVLNWPPAFDLSYSNVALQGAATDGLPMGDLNWFPDAKATYLANREDNIAALVDSITNATALYIPGDPESERITAANMVAIEYEGGAALAKKYELAQNYPNPFNPTTNIGFAVPVSGKVKLTVYNLVGQVVATLVDEQLFAGKYSVNFDAANLPSGMYIYKLRAGDTLMSKKLMVLK
ncbi:T9SS type A sorting domain-containing protein, partial [candidate division KSB1 bacterium]|nr:T9SS type A sorting domain-containing protein [candidate division KSB1 bacterium]